MLSQRQPEADATPLELGAAPDVVGQLVESFLADVPSPRHRLALDCAAQARLTPVALAILASRPFIEGHVRRRVREPARVRLIDGSDALDEIAATGPRSRYPHLTDVDEYQPEVSHPRRPSRHVGVDNFESKDIT